MEKVGKKTLRNIAKKRSKGKYGRKEELKNGEKDGGKERDRSFVKSCLSLYIPVVAMCTTCFNRRKLPLTHIIYLCLNGYQ
jgi:hypothetical protein